MTLTLTDGKTDIGAFKFPDRKKPCLCVKTGGKIKFYGHFNTIEGAEEFMKELGKLVHARMDGDER